MAIVGATSEVATLKQALDEAEKKKQEEATEAARPLLERLKRLLLDPERLKAGLPPLAAAGRAAPP